MATEGLKIVIGADLGAAITGIANLNNALESVGDAAASAAQGLNRIPAALRPINPAQMQKLRDTVVDFKREIEQIPKTPIPDPFKNVAKGANAAGFALTNVGRVAQDLPFGFVGIQNNLNPLLESFQRLKAETGSGSAALKALAGSLIGAGGIGLALSVVSSAILIFQNGIAGFNKKSKEAKEAADELAKSIRSISSIEGEATAGTSGQLAQVNALASAVSDSNKPYAERKRALEELKEINKAYFGDLKLEDAATGTLTKTVEKYTKALINSAIQKQFVDEIAKVAKAVSDSDEKIRISRDKLTRANEDVANKQAEATNRQLEANKRGAIAQAALTDPEVVQALKLQADAQDELATNSDNSTKLLEQQAIITDRLNKAVKVGLKLKDLDAAKTAKEIDLLKKRLEALEKIKDVTKDINELVGLEEQIFDLKVKITLRDAAKNGLSKSETDLAIKGFRDQLQQAFLNQAIALEAIPKVKFSDVKKVEIPTDINDRITKATGLDKKIPEITLHDVRIKLLGVKITNAIEEAERASKLIQETLLQGITGVIEGSSEAFGNALGEIFSGGDIGSAFAKAAQSILGLIGGVLQEVGKQIIATSALIKALKESLKTLFVNPAAGIAIGIALIAAGSFLKNIKLPGFAEGGMARGPKSGYLAVLHGNELIIPESKLGKTNTGGIQGASFDRPIILQPSVSIQGQALRILLDRVDRTNGRLF